MVEKKISIITVVYNGQNYIERCIKSIISQNYSNYEHIIIDGKSTDNTISIIEKYRDKYPMIYISEEDNGMYDALMKGFSMSTGDIMAWLNADDTYMPWAFQVMNYAVGSGREWFTCVNSWQNDNDIIYRVGDAYVYEQRLIQKGYYLGKDLPFIQQESTFWTSSLWKKANVNLANYKLAGDFYLWCEFSKYSPLYTVKTVVASFRVHAGQKSSNLNEYYKEIDAKKVSRVKFKIDLIKNKIFRKYLAKKYLINIPNNVGEV
jgi:glycosyltransferase involved in cell wall biosynthesis